MRNSDLSEWLGLADDIVSVLRQNRIRFCDHVLKDDHRIKGCIDNEVKVLNLEGNFERE